MGLGLSVGAGSGCGDEDKDADGSDIFGSCDVSALNLCTEYSGLDSTAASLEASCEAAPATWSTSACISTTSCGSCSFDIGEYVSETYYFDGAGAEASLDSVCESSGGTWSDIAAVTCT